MRVAADPSARLALLSAARKKVGRKKTIVNADEMAQIAGITWRHLKPMIDADPDFPVDRRGSEGVSWEFNAAKVLDHMIKRQKEKVAERDARASRVAKLSGISLEMASSGLSVADLVKIDQLQTSAQKRKIEQREWIRRSEHEEVVAKILTTTQTETLATVSRLDPAGVWPPEVRADVADAMRTLLVRLHDELGKSLVPDARP